MEPDTAGLTWAKTLGQRARQNHPRVKVPWRYCPFKDGTPHRDAWLEGWNSATWETCALCNYDRHTCKGCGDSLSHGETTCSPCKALYCV